MTPKTAKELIEFENEIIDLYLDAKIRAPVHLCIGSEEPLIEIFKSIRKQDWIFSHTRWHYHALLKGVPPPIVKKAIVDGAGMHFDSREYRFSTSGILCGQIPIAVGIAMSIKRKGLDEHVHVFVGDMASKMGIMHECCIYSQKQNLPITFVIEDNGLSVDTPTHDIWGYKDNGLIRYYSYKRKYPHHGVGSWVKF